MGGLKAFPANVHCLSALSDGFDVLTTGFQYHCGHDIAVVGVFIQYVKNRLVHLLLGRRQRHELFRTPIDLATLKIHDALAQGFVGGGLFGTFEGRVNIQSARIGLLSVLDENQLTYHFCYIFGVNLIATATRSDSQLLILGCLRFLFIDESVVQHAVNDVALANTRSFRVADGVIGRRRLG